MKIGIVTFHFVNNFGGALQAYALQRYVSEMFGAEVELIDYHNYFIRLTDGIRIFPVTKNISELKSGFQTIGQRRGRLSKFRGFLEKNCTLTRRYHSNLALKLHKPECDKYICGSDQIWNPILTGGISKPYFLTFEKDNRKKISYAPSLGTNRLPDFVIKRIVSYTREFNGLSIREQESAEIYEQFSGRKPQRVIDPTFLLTPKQWNDVLVEVEVPEKYILVYLMQKDDSAYAFIKSVKEKMNLPVVEISRYGYKPDFIDKMYVDVGPSEFLGLFKNASFVCTNSYHGLVFSMIFDKRLCLIPSKRFRSRVKNLLNLLEIPYPERISDNELGNLDYDTEILRKKIESERDRSFAYLQQSIEG